MTPERWQEVKKILAEALERTPAERSAYLDRACTEPEVRREVESLIAAHERAGSGFMEQAPIKAVRFAQPGEYGEALKSGSRLGPYQILGALGAGGLSRARHSAGPRRSD